MFDRGSRRCLSWFWLLGVLAIISCSRAPEARIRNVVLISLDTCRADHLSCMGFGKATTPNLDALAARGMLFTDAITPMPMTLPAHSSLFTGTHPAAHGVHDNVNFTLADAASTMAEYFQARGFETHGIIGAFVLDPKFGIAQGFDVYDCEFERPLGSGDALERRADEVSDHACAFLTQPKDKPFLLFLHYYDPHTPYAPPESFATQFPDDPYSGEIAFADAQIGRVLDTLDSAGLTDETLIVVIGDHGESLGEHGESEHGYFVYQAGLHVPMILAFPGGPQGVSIDAPASLVDIFPTILSLLHLDIPETVQGADLSMAFDETESVAQTPRLRMAESFIPTQYGCSPLLTLIDGEFKYIESSLPELYDLSRDPDESNNLVSQDADRAIAMEESLTFMLAELAQPINSASTEGTDEATRAQLESLGYIGGATDTSLDFDRSKPDAKDWIAYHERHQRVLVLGHEKKFDEAAELCLEMLQRWPDMPNTHYLLAKLSFSQGKHQPTLRQATIFLKKTRPTNDRDLNEAAAKERARCLHLAAQSAYALDDLAGAIDFWREAVQLTPDWPVLHQKLGDAFYQTEQPEQARHHWESALESRDHWPEVHHNLGSVCYQLGDADCALTHLAKAVRQQPQWGEARQNLFRLAIKLQRPTPLTRIIPEIQSTQDSTARDELAQALFQLEAYEQAAVLWDEAAHLDSQNAQYPYRLGAALYRINRIDAAIEAWQNALDLNPNWAEVHHNLGNAFLATNRPDQAEHHWRQAARLKPEWDAPRESLRRIQ